LAFEGPTNLFLKRTSKNLIRLWLACFAITMHFIKMHYARCLFPVGISLKILYQRAPLPEKIGMHCCRRLRFSFRECRTQFRTTRINLSRRRLSK